MKTELVILLTLSMLANAKNDLIATPLLEIESQRIINVASVRLGIPSSAITDELITVIRTMAHAILRADHATVNDILSTYECPSRSNHQCTKGDSAPASINQASIPELVKTNVATATSHALTTATNILKACATKHTLHAAYELLNAARTTEKKLSIEKENDESLDNVIRATPLLHCAHRIAVDTILRLLIITFSPKALGSKRTRALIILNHCSLMGKKGRYFNEFMARTNRYYFTKHGLINSYDPSHNSHTIKRRVKELARIFALLSSHEVHYSSLVYEAQRQGIGDIIEIPRSAGHWKGKAKKFFWNYTTGIVKQIGGYDISELRTVDPQKVVQKPLTKDLMLYMEELAEIETCAGDYNSFKQQALVVMHRFVEKYRGVSCVAHNHLFVDIFTHYYLDTLRLLKK